MSPRRKVDADELDFFQVKPAPPRRWGLPILSALTALLIAAAIGWGGWMFNSHQEDRRSTANDAQALDYVQSFMTMYTSLDPFHANDYVDRVQAEATGDFAKMFNEKQNEILIQVAQAEPTKGSVVAAGVKQWRDDGSAEILVATKITSKTPDGKQTIESGDRWVATAIKEGQQWKISQLIQVI